MQCQSCRRSRLSATRVRTALRPAWPSLGPEERVVPNQRQQHKQPHAAAGRSLSPSLVRVCAGGFSALLIAPPIRRGPGAGYRYHYGTGTWYLYL